MKSPKLFAPNRLTEDCLCGHVISPQTPNDYKPSLGILSDKEMVMFTMHSHFESEKHVNEFGGNTYPQITHTVMYRTTDGGETWRCCGHMPFGGVEPSVTVLDGVLLVQSSEFNHMFTNHKNYTTNIYRSDDKGKTWTDFHLTSELLGCDENAGIYLNRTFIQLKNGDFAGFINLYRDNGRNRVLRMISKDRGKTWQFDEVTVCVKQTENPVSPVMEESVYYYTPSGRLIAVARVNWAVVHPDACAQIPHALRQERASDIDQHDGMILMESEDDGLTWKPIRGLGYFGMMYPSIVYLNDRDFVLTYTKRVSSTHSPYPKVGVQAVLGRENEDGSFNIDFDHDIIIIDDCTPTYSTSGGGYGRTELLSDGTLITPYSYRLNSEEIEDILKRDAYADDEVYLKYSQNTNQSFKCPNHAFFKTASPDLQKYLILEFAHEKQLSRITTDLLKWKIDLP